MEIPISIKNSKKMATKSLKSELCLSIRKTTNKNLQTAANSNFCKISDRKYKL